MSKYFIIITVKMTNVSYNYNYFYIFIYNCKKNYVLIYMF